MVMYDDLVCDFKNYRGSQTAKNLIPSTPHSYPPSGNYSYRPITPISCRELVHFGPSGLRNHEPPAAAFCPARTRKMCDTNTILPTNPGATAMTTTTHPTTNSNASIPPTTPPNENRETARTNPPPTRFHHTTRNAQLPLPS